MSTDFSEYFSPLNGFCAFVNLLYEEKSGLSLNADMFVEKKTDSGGAYKYILYQGTWRRKILFTAGVVFGQKVSDWKQDGVNFTRTEIINITPLILFIDADESFKEVIDQALKSHAKKLEETYGITPRNINKKFR